MRVCVCVCVHVRAGASVFKDICGCLGGLFMQHCTLLHKRQVDGELESRRRRHSVLVCECVCLHINVCMLACVMDRGLYERGIG